MPKARPKHVDRAFSRRGAHRRKGLDDGPGHADMETLRVVDAAIAEAIRHGLIRDEFGHGLLPHASRDLYERLDDELVRGIGAKATNEVAIDLEIVEGEMLQVIERAESGAKVIQREAAPATPQFSRKRLGVVDVADRRRFGQLEDQARGVEYANPRALDR